MPFERRQGLQPLDTIQPKHQQGCGDFQSRGAGQGRQTAARFGGNDHDHPLLRLLRQAVRPHVRAWSGAALLLSGLPPADGGAPPRLDAPAGGRTDRQRTEGDQPDGGCGLGEPGLRILIGPASALLHRPSCIAPPASHLRRSGYNRIPAVKSLASLAEDGERYNLRAVTLAPRGAGAWSPDSATDRRSPASPCSTCLQTRMSGPAF